MRPSTNQLVERWLGQQAVDQVREAVRSWYGPPIAIAGVPGVVRAARGGDLHGRIRTGRFSTFADYAYEEAKRRLKRFSRNQRRVANAGFSSLSDLISEATSGAKKRVYPFIKNGPTGVVSVTSTLWRLGASPPAGAAPGAAPGGTATDDATTGTWPMVNPTGGDTQHFTTGYPASSVGGNTLLLYDRLFHVLKTMNSSATEAVTGVPTRYQSTTAANADYVGGNFLFIEVGGTALPATAHNWTVCTYKDQADAASTLPSIAGVASAIVDRLDHASWFCPLETGDVGVKALTQMQCSALVATGVINFVIGHPIAFMPCPIANLICVLDGINSAFNLTRIFDDACLAMLEIQKGATTATTYAGTFESCAG
jgi:hypothetical protein